MNLKKMTHIPGSPTRSMEEVSCFMVLMADRITANTLGILKCGSCWCLLSLGNYFVRCAGDIYDGEWVSHQRHGSCRYTWTSGEVMKNGLRFLHPCLNEFFLCSTVSGVGLHMEQRHLRKVEGHEC